MARKRSRLPAICFASYLQKDRYADVPMAIPSFCRETALCEQTLTMLRSYDWNMRSIHVFVDALHRHPDGVLEYDKYFKALQRHGFADVHLHPGGRGLCKQYDRIFEFFHDVPCICLMSDTVPSIQWRRRPGSAETADLPRRYLKPLVAMMFDACEQEGYAAWSLSPCKNQMNLLPGHLSRKCGLLDGNFFGARVQGFAPPRFTVSDYTTDVEFTLRTWSRDKGFIRFLGATAMHTYRSPGGHASTGMSTGERADATDRAIQCMAAEFPTLLVHNKSKTCRASMPYTFVPKGGPPRMVKGLYCTKGRKPQNGWKPMSQAERTRKWRARRNASL